MELSQQQEQRQLLRPGLRRSLEVLQLTRAELETRLQEAALSNPLLALEPDTPPEGKPPTVWALPGGKPGGAAADALDRLADPATRGQSLAEALAEQLPPSLPENLRRLCLYLIGCLDENGWLPFALADLAGEEGVPLSAMEKALATLQGLQPAGVGARSLTECLTLQLVRSRQDNPRTLRLVQPDGLALLAAGSLRAVAELLDCSRSEARQAAAAVRALQPRPAQGYGTGEPPAPQLPEAVFHRSEAGVEIQLGARLSRRLSLDEEACTLLRQTGSEEDRRYLREKQSEARQLIRAVEEREYTLVRLLRAVARDQEGYFLRGEPLQPMTMTALARRLGLSLSTVSRAIQGKTIQFEGRSLTLRRFFTAAITAPDGTRVASEAVRRQLLQLVRQENPRHPLSDEALRTALAAAGLPVARRTVAKYRQALGIPAASARRRKVAKP